MPALQTQPQEGKWSTWHTCHYILPPALSYSIIALDQASINAQLQCHLQLQFVSMTSSGLIGENLTDVSCLNEIEEVQGNAVVLKLSLQSYATTKLIELVRDYALQFKQRQRVVRHSSQQLCSDDLVNFQDEGFRQAVVVNYNDHSGDCLAKLHLPYGYATQLRFNIITQSSPDGTYLINMYNICFGCLYINYIYILCELPNSRLLVST